MDESRDVRGTGGSLSKDDRREAWRSIRKDDSQALFKVLSSERKIDAARCGLYNPLKAVGVRSRSLPELLSLSGKGVPSIGAVECLRTLLFKYSHLYTREELEGLARRARRKNRVLAAELLEDAALRDDDVADVEYPHRDLNELPTECIEARTACA